MPGPREGISAERPNLKPFAVIFAVVLLFVLIVFALYRGTSIMITSVFDANNNASEFACSDGRVFHVRGDGRDALDVKAVEVEPEDVRYFGGWDALLEQVDALGANAVLAGDVMEPAFYDALKAWDDGADANPIYLIQRVRLGDEAYADMTDIIDGGAAEQLHEQGLFAIDAIHGSRIFQGYVSDVSRYVMGICIGDDWDPDLLAYTQQRREGEVFEYLGMYYTCTSSFVPFEARLAKVMDGLISYEIGKFDHRTPFGIWNWSMTDEVEHTPAAMRDSSSIATLWQSYVQPTEECEVGTFACYNLLDESSPMVAVDADYAAEVESGRASSVYEAYAADVVETAACPVIVSSRASSARGVSGSDHGYAKRFGAADEQAQGKRYRELVEGALEGGAAGFSLPLCDDVDAVSWNTRGVADSNGLWRNIQCPDQYCGVMAVDDGVSVVVDGDGSEWEELGAASPKGVDGLQVAYDSEYLYLLVAASGFDRGSDSLAVPIDVTPLSGASDYEGRLSFDRAADFVVDLSGEVPELQVQRYYNHYWAVQTLTHAEMEQPNRDSNEFGTFYQCVQERDYLSDGVTVRDLEEEYYPTGGLLEGRDYAIGESCIELRIPWALLNFYDPSSGTILGDYYEMDGAENRLVHIDGLYVGAGVNATEDPVRLGRIELPGWSRVSWTAREKDSASLVREAFDSR